MLSGRFPLSQIGEMQFDKRKLDGQDGVPEGEAGMGIGSGIEKSDWDRLPEALYVIDERTFRVALEMGKLMPSLVRAFSESLNYLSQACRSVEVGFSDAKQVEVGTIDEADDRQLSRTFCKIM